MTPDPDRLNTPVEPGAWTPDMFLYHSNDNHYDLLVSDEEEEEEPEPEKHSNMWNTVQHKKKSSKEEEKLLIEDKPEENYDTKDLDELDEELTLFRSKNSGHRRTAPQVSAESKESVSSFFVCTKCGKKLESEGLLDAHMSSHAKSKFACEVCDLLFDKSLDLEMHKIEQHETQEKLGEWNCNDCFHQAGNASDLMKHLKVSGHQPSPNIQNKRMVFQDYKECYTCRLEFDGYWNLMTHRKNVHPSNKRCRNYPSGKCTFGVDCWYVHEEELMDIDESFKADAKPDATIFKCYLCTSDFQSKDNFMKHKKHKHTSGVQICEKFN